MDLISLTQWNSWPLLDPALVAVKQWSIVLLGRIFSLPLSNIVGVSKVLVKMSLELLILDESHTAI